MSLPGASLVLFGLLFRKWPAAIRRRVIDSAGGFTGAVWSTVANMACGNKEESDRLCRGFAGADWSTVANIACGSKDEGFDPAGGFAGAVWSTVLKMACGNKEESDRLCRGLR
jgi:hypothetical protein